MDLRVSLRARVKFLEDEWVKLESQVLMLQNEVENIKEALEWKN